MPPQTLVATTGPTAVTPLAKLVVTSFPRIPLTTQFDLPDDCYGVQSDDVYLIDQHTSCLPSGWSPAETAFFSPGLICPEGYTSACHDNGGVSTITTVTCCPQRGDVALQCVVEPTELASSLSNYYCRWEAPAAGFTTDVTKSPNGKTITEHVTLKSPDALNGYGVRMVYQSTDKLTTGMTGTPTANETSEATFAKSTASSSASSSATSVSGSSNTAISTTAVVVIALSHSHPYRLLTAFHMRACKVQRGIRCRLHRYHRAPFLILLAS
ncbi:uncharacterized protein B0T23DRAFT_310770 [Neurospora hispaniola]|uniref:Uncharacterized protein n=1 Tax=Neurospora hispaniola TaxID=588809 RepID=A0AAJ0ID25_9PEZI|nr:hypothetical protein B0T23DRAFT_310770 [Neurospora hispaniola]